MMGEESVDGRGRVNIWWERSLWMVREESMDGGGGARGRHIRSRSISGGVI